MTCQNGSPPLGLALTNLTLENGIQRMGVGLNVGTPPQTLAIWPTTSDDATWVANAGYCPTAGTEDYCIGYYTGVYNSSTSSTYSASTFQTWNGSEGAESSFSTFTQQDLAEWTFFNDKISFGDNGTSYGFPLSMRDPTKTQFSGLGIGFNSTFLNQAVKSGSAPTANWGLWTGSRSIDYPAAGALYLGGYDTNRINGNLTTFTSPNYPTCLTCAQISDITYNYPGGSQTLMSNSSERLSVAFNPFNAYLQVTNDVYQNFLAITRTQGTYLGYDSNGVAIYKSSANLGNFTVTIHNTVSGDYTTTIPEHEMFYLPRDTNNNGDLVYTNTTYKFDAFYNVTTSPSSVLEWGWPFLAMNYMVMDFDNKQFRLGQAVQGSSGQSSGALIQPLCEGIAVATVTPVVSPGASPSSSGTNGGPGGVKSKTNVGAIAGGVVGGVVGLALIAALVFFIMRGKRREKTLKEERDAAVAGGSEAAAGPHHERMSQFTAQSPTEVSEVYGGKGHEYNSVNQWLHTQKHDPSELQSHSELEENQASHASNASQPPNSPRPYATQTTATMNEPFEMPAYQYR